MLSTTLMPGLRFPTCGANVTTDVPKAGSSKAAIGDGVIPSRQSVNRTPHRGLPHSRGLKVLCSLLRTFPEQAQGDPHYRGERGRAPIFRE